jgi:hypothetical protein
MRNTQFADLCFVLIVVLLAVIAFTRDTTAYAAQKFTYQVVPVHEGTTDQNLVALVEKETRAGWEVVAAPMWRFDAWNSAQGFLIVRK